MAGDSVQQVKDRINILDVVSGYVELHKAGKHYKGKSPFSPEKTPSFYVSPDRGMYYCFSTSQGGDMFTFVEAMEGVDFKGALKILADKAGVELVPEDPKKKNERERVLTLLEAATEYFATELAGNTDAKEYLEKRAVSGKTILTWRLGYAPGPPVRGWRELRMHLKALGYTDEEMLKAGVIKTTENGKEPFDVFRDRVMFPMAEQNGKVVAYSGRILAKDSDAPKYVNSPETMLYKKSELLFGYDKAKSGIRELNFSLIVEGQFDVVMCHQAGYHNAVAVSGTALTPHHIGLLERLSPRIVLALDADRAGVGAVKRAAELMLRRALDVKVATMPEGKDPADLIADDPKQFKHVIGISVHVIEYLLQTLKSHAKDDRTFKLQAREEVVPLIARMPNRIEQEHFAATVADSLGVTKDSILYEIERVRERTSTPVASGTDVVSKTTIHTERNTWSEQAAELAVYIAVASEVLTGPVADKLKATIAKHDELKTALSSALEDADTKVTSELSFRIEAFVEKSTDLTIEQELWHRLTRWYDLATKVKLRTLRAKLTEAEQTADTVLSEELLQEISIVQQRLRENPFTEENS